MDTRIRRLGIRATFEVRRLLGRLTRPLRRRSGPSFHHYAEFWESLARQYQAEGRVHRTIGATSQALFDDSARVLFAGCVHNGLRPEHRVLDIGCGSGRLAQTLRDYLKPPGAYWGVDVAPTLIAEARKSISRPDFTFLVSQSLPLPFEKRAFDFIALFSVFTHLYDEDVMGFLREIRRLIAPTGTCVVSVLADPGIPASAGTIGEMRHNVAFLRRLIEAEGLRLASVQQSWILPFVDDPARMTHDTGTVNRDEGGCQTCLVLRPA